jgi:hypothetical protein
MIFTFFVALFYPHSSYNLATKMEAAGDGLVRKAHQTLVPASLPNLAR